MSQERNNLFENESLKMLLEEFTGEQQTNNKILDDLVKSVNQLTGKVSQMEEKLAKPKLVQVTVNTEAVQKIVKEGITTIKVLAAAKPRPLVRKIRVLLFPEQDARLFYKIVFGRWFLMLVILFGLSCLYRFGIHWNDNRQIVKIVQLENDRIRKAWHYLYFQKGKNIRSLMDKAYSHVEGQNKEKD
jgi:hypothetical protein